MFKGRRVILLSCCACAGTLQPQPSQPGRDDGRAGPERSIIPPCIAGSFTFRRSCWTQLAQATLTGKWHMDETYIKVRGRWMHLYRAIDSVGDSVEFFLSENRDLSAAKRFFRQAFARHGRPDRIVIDGSQTNREAICLSDAENRLRDRSQRSLKPIRIRQSQYLNNRIEQDHRRIKRRIRSMLGLQVGGNRQCEIFRAHAFEYACARNDIEHRTTKARHPWTNGQVERMNRTIKDATVKRFYYESHDQLRTHLADFVAAYNFARRLKTLKGLTPYEFICKAWASQPERFKLNPLQQIRDQTSSLSGGADRQGLTAS